MEDLQDIARQIERSAPGLQVHTLQLEGEGDFCRAYTVNDAWIFRFAWNEEGSRALEREIVLLPELNLVATLPIPNIAYSGRLPDTGFAFVVYPRIPGTELTPQRLVALDIAKQERCATELARFLREIHSLGPARAMQLGVLRCGYPFCRTEEGIAQGPAALRYRLDLQKLLNYPAIDEDTGGYLRNLVDKLLDPLAPGDLPQAPVHGDLSPEHILFDETTGSMTGVIDFSDVVVTSPLLDFMYLYHSYGADFLTMLVEHYGVVDPGATIERVRLLHQWYLAIRLLWVLEHDYEPGIEPRLAALVAARDRAG
jgi:aminoglycoside 2''-phosphotransferase